jgi:hypothetical protein
VVCAAGSASRGGPAFGALTAWQSAFGGGDGGAGQVIGYGRVQYPDINGDGTADACAMSEKGVECGLGNGRDGFGTPTLWWTAAANDIGWESYETLQYPDLNGDGKADVCQRSSEGIVCAISNGTSAFTGTSVWEAAFGDVDGSAPSPSVYETIQFPDVDGDGKADLCARTAGGVECALSKGTSFGPLSAWEPAFDDANGWASDPSYYETIRFPDLDGDGKADICGRGSDGLECARSDGTSFTTSLLFGDVEAWQSQSPFSDANGWKSSYALTIQYPDVNGDGKADVCARGQGGIVCALSDGRSFQDQAVWQPEFADSKGWGGSYYFESIEFPDVDGDGKADVCARASGGLECALSDGAEGFGALALRQNQLVDSDGWNGSAMATSLGFPIVNFGTCERRIRPAPQVLKYVQDFGSYVAPTVIAP